MSLGGFAEYRAVTDEDKTLFAKFATEIASQANGVALVPEKVAEQIVSGKNFKFVCQDGYEVVIYQKGAWDGGEASLTSVTKA